MTDTEYEKELLRRVNQIQKSKYYRFIIFLGICQPNKIAKRRHTTTTINIKRLENKLDELVPPYTFKLWQKYNKIKKRVKFIFYLSVFSLPSVTYSIITVIYFTASYVVYLLSLPFKKTLRITKQQQVLDGVSFIIPTWNKKNMVSRCIRLLDDIASKEKGQLKIEIVVIENGSTDGSFISLSKLNTKNELVIIRNKKNYGFAQAINQGASKAKYNYIYLLNNDMEVQPNFLKTLISYTKKLVDNNQKFFGISSQIFFYNKIKRREESGKTYCQPRLGFINVAHYVKDVNLNKPSITLYPGGGSSLINKHLFNLLGQMDYKTYTPLYCEDLDLGFSAWKFGYPSFFLPTSQVVHHHQSSSKKLISDPTFYMYKNLLALVLKNIDSLHQALQHVFLFSSQILINKKYKEYSIEVIANILSIFLARTRLNRYKSVSSYTHLLNFVLFETSIYDSKK